MHRCGGQGLVGPASNKGGSRYGAAASVTSQAASVDGKSDRLTKNTPMYAGALKPLHDSCYVVPEKNHRVLQDTDPVKSETFRQALARHEEQVKAQKNFNEKVITSHYEKIKSDVDQI